MSTHPEPEKTLGASRPRQTGEGLRKEPRTPLRGRTIHCERPLARRWHDSQVVAKYSCPSHFTRGHPVRASTPRVVRHGATRMRESGRQPSSCRLTRFTSCSRRICVPVEGPYCCHGHHCVDTYMTSSAKWHVSAILHSSSSLRHCCIFGLLPWSVRRSSIWFQTLCCIHPRLWVPSSLPSLSAPRVGNGGTSLIFCN